LPHFGWWCLLPWSRCLGAHLIRPSEWKLWVSWLPNFKCWRSYAHGLCGLARGFVTYSLDRHSVMPDGLTIWMRSPGGLGRSKLHDGRSTLSWRPCRLWLREFWTWCWTTSMSRLLWQHLCPRWWSFLRVRSTAWSLMGSAGDLVCIGCCLVAFLRAGNRAGVFRVMVQCGPDR
jgi:hypothetical protein